MATDTEEQSYLRVLYSILHAPVQVTWRRKVWSSILLAAQQISHHATNSPLTASSGQPPIR